MANIQTIGGRRGWDTSSHDPFVLSNVDVYLKCRRDYEFLDDTIKDYDGHSHCVTLPLYREMDKIIDHMREMHRLLGEKLASLDQHAPQTDILIPLTEDQLWQNRNPAYPYLM